MELRNTSDTPRDIAFRDCGGHISNGVGKPGYKDLKLMPIHSEKDGGAPVNDIPSLRLLFPELLDVHELAH